MQSSRSFSFCITLAQNDGSCKVLTTAVKNKNSEPSNINHIKLSVSHRRLAPPLSLRIISLSCPYGLGEVREISSIWPTHSFYLINIDFSESEWGEDFWGRGAQSKTQGQILIRCKDTRAQIIWICLSPGISEFMLKGNPCGSPGEWRKVSIFRGMHTRYTT